MARKATGQVIEPKDGRGWALRFRAYGVRRYVTLGTAGNGWDRERAEAELRHVLADVERGIWRPHEPEPVKAPEEAPTFHEFASWWFEANKHGWAERTVADYQWALSYHLLRYFAKHRLSEITVEEVDRYRTTKLREGKLAPPQINKTKRLSQILEVAEEYDKIARNPARGRRRRAKVTKQQRSWVEPEQVSALIHGGSPHMRPVIATLIGAGLRVSEAVALDWSDVNLDTGTLTVGRAKTDAGSYRQVDLPSGLVNELTERWVRSTDDLARWKARNPDQGSPVFLSAHAGRIRRQSAANVARRLKTAIKHANRKLDKLGIEPISERVTPHSLRRTYASLRGALRDDPVYIAEQLGHTDPRFTLAVYTKAVKRRAKLSGEYLAEYERALAWAALPTANGQRMGSEPLLGVDRQPAALDGQTADLA
jgi:integrase